MNQFTPIAWAHSTNIYEVNVRQYTYEGTFSAFAAHLPRLKDMGVEVLWFMPITPISQELKKGTLGSYYACSDYTAINPEFGTLQDFKTLVKQAHDLGMKVIIDWVANHTGWGHVWTKSNPGFYKVNANTGQFFTAKGMDDIIELDFDNPYMVQAMIDAMIFWINECAIDGFRCDLASWVRHEFWVHARTEIEKVKKVFWLGEFDPLQDREYFGTFDAAYTWQWMHLTEDFYKKQLSFAVLEKLLYDYNSIQQNGMMAWFTSNHDENSWNGTEYEKYGDMAKMLAVFSCTWNGMPLVYSGQELPNLKRLKFFDKDEIEWTDKCALHDFYKKLLHLHSTHPAMRACDDNVATYHLQTNANDKVLTFLRKNGNDEVLVMLNFSRDTIQWQLNDVAVQGEFENLFTAEKQNAADLQAATLQPWEYQVWVK